MLKKKFNTIELKSGEKKLTVVFEDKGYELLSTFFFVEAGSFESWIRQNITEVLQGKAESRDISGNICELIIGKENTVIYDTLADDGKGSLCTVPTRELLNLLDEWSEIVYKLKHTKGELL